MKRESVLYLQAAAKGSVMDRVRKILNVLCLIILLPAACAVDETMEGRPCGGTSCGGGNPPTFRFHAPFTGTASLYALSQNPVMDSLPLWTRELAGADSLRLSHDLLDSILAMPRLDSILRNTLPAVAGNPMPDSLAFNMSFRTADSGWLVPGIGYKRGSTGAGRIFTIASLLPIHNYTGKARLPNIDLTEDQQDPVDFLYLPGTPHYARVRNDSLFSLDAFPASEGIASRAFRWFVERGNAPGDTTHFALLNAKDTLAAGAFQELDFNPFVDSITTTWFLRP